MDKYHLHLKLASYCMLTMTRSVCCVSLFLKYMSFEKGHYPLHTTSNPCTKYEPPASKMKEEVVLKAGRQILNIFDLEL